VPGRAWLPRAALAGAVIMGLGAGPVAAQEADAPLMIQTVPALEGVELSVFGSEIATDEHGLAVATGPRGTHELSAPTSGARADTRWEFSGWSDGIGSPTRTVTLASFTFLEVGYDVYDRVTLSLVDHGGEAIPETVDSVRLVDDRGTRVGLPGSGWAWLLAQRAVDTPTGLASENVRYRVEGIVGAGGDLVARAGGKISPAPGERLEIAVERAESASGTSPSPRSEVAVREPSQRVESPGSGWLWLLVAAGASTVLVAYARRFGAGGELLTTRSNETRSERVRRAGERARARVMHAGSLHAKRPGPVAPVLGPVGRWLVVVVESAQIRGAARAREKSVVLVERIRGWGGALVDAWRRARDLVEWRRREELALLTGPNRRMPLLKDHERELPALVSEVDPPLESLTDAERRAGDLAEGRRREELALLDEPTRRLPRPEDYERELAARISEMERQLEELTRRVNLGPREIQLAKVAALINAPTQQAINVLAAPLRNLGFLLAQVVARKQEETAGEASQERGSVGPYHVRKG
jgi:hypothetical protein